jgi:pimeloyl-ACP methyl ester carboxylesterase
MTSRLLIGARVLAVSFTAGMTIGTQAVAQEAVKAAVDTSFIFVDGARVQYIDFGGNGLPLVFTAGSWPADTWLGFAPRFADRHRVLAVTHRGVPPSEGNKWGYLTRAQDMLALLDSLGFERAVFAGNANPASSLIYIAEHHPDRVAGLVFLAPASEAGYESVDDPSGAMQMVGRAALSAQGRNPDEPGTDDASYLYQPRYMSAPGQTIDIPSITFVNRNGNRGLQESYYPLQIAEMVGSRTLTIPDSVSQRYFERLAKDSLLRREVRAAWDTVFAPAITANEQAFFRAFGDHMRVIRIDVPEVNGVPFLTGYEYRDAPELIEAHIHEFLAAIRKREGRPGSSLRGARTRADIDPPPLERRRCCCICSRVGNPAAQIRSAPAVCDDPAFQSELEKLQQSAGPSGFRLSATNEVVGCRVGSKELSAGAQQGDKRGRHHLVRSCLRAAAM